MEKVGALDRKTVVSVLTHGRELANELKNQLHPINTSKETCDSLLEKILSSYEKAIKLLDCMALLGNGDPSQIALSSSPENSPRSEGSELSSKNKDVSKKRKTMAKWSEQVRVFSGTGQLDDGYNWRKYGQKDILGARHPRAYYRCTHRNTQGCLATKQVQRADEDPAIFEVMYKGKHSCIQERIKRNKPNDIVPNKEEESQRQSLQMVTSFEPQLKAETSQMDHEEDWFPSFSFPSSTLDYENGETQFFSEPNNLFGASYSPPFLSPATSDSYFSLSPCPMNDFAIGHSLQSPESDFGEIISNPTSATSIPSGEMDFSITDMSFESHFLDALDYFK